jgi:hypothetical protein
MGLLAVEVQLMPLGVDVHVGVGVHVVVIEVQLVVGEGSVWLRSDDAALVMVALAVAASVERALVVSAGTPVTVAKGDATTVERNTQRHMKRVVRENICLRGMNPECENGDCRNLKEMNVLMIHL